MADFIFKYGFNEQDEDEANARGYLGHVQVKTEGGLKYSVVFYDPIRLKQDLEEEGDGFIAEPGMIILESICLKNMQYAVNLLEKNGFFNKLSPDL